MKYFTKFWLKFFSCCFCNTCLLATYPFRNRLYTVHSTYTQMLHVWNIYLHDWIIWWYMLVNILYMEHMEYIYIYCFWNLETYQWNSPYRNPSTNPSLLSYNSNALQSNITFMFHLSFMVEFYTPMSPMHRENARSVKGISLDLLQVQCGFWWFCLGKTKKNTSDHILRYPSNSHCVCCVCWLIIPIWNCTIK